ncbi:MAG: hypothetical protein AB7I27_09000 [Bacteriovoracaceae bacterium]
MNKIKFLLFLTLIGSCTQLSTTRNEAREVILNKVSPQLEKILLQGNPINPPKWSTYPIVQNLPDNSFDPRKTIKSLFTYDSKGRLVLLPGDYTFPVMTYCMSSEAQSPAGHIYSLSKLGGKRAKVIRELNLLAPAKYFTHEIQMVSWGLQNGLSYEELGKLGQEMIDSVIPHYKLELQESILTGIEKKWNRASELSEGILPYFNESTEILKKNLGELGKRIQEMREYKNHLREFGYDYRKLSEKINTTTSSKRRGETPWSKISNNVYARFITENSFGEIGYLQVRVLAYDSGREINSENNKQQIFDLVSLIANPNSDAIQPLTFSPLYGVTGTIVLTPSLSRHPLAGALLLASVLSAKYVDWEAFFNLYDILQDSNDRDIQKEIKRGIRVLRKEHDILEKPLKEAGIISGKDKKTSIKEKNEVREYRKPGGEEQLQKDFDKIEGVPSKKKGGIETKTLSDETTVVKRPKDGDTPATLEVQPPEGDSRYPDSKIRVKVRYP